MTQIPIQEVDYRQAGWATDSTSAKQATPNTVPIPPSTPACTDVLTGIQPDLGPHCYPERTRMVFP